MIINDNFKFSVESVKRILKDNISFTYKSYVIEFGIDKDFNCATFNIELADNNNICKWKTSLLVNKTDRSVNTLNSHEDPLIEYEEEYKPCIHIESKKFNEIKNEVSKIAIWNDDIYIEKKLNLSETFRHESLESCFLYNQTTKKLEVLKSGKLTFHLTNKQGKYYEETLKVESGNIIDVIPLTKNNIYVGIQISYSDSILDYEDKIILIGQKGLLYSGVFTIENEKITTPFPFVSDLQTNIENLIEINDLNDFYNYYKNKEFYNFEFNLPIDDYNYRNFATYNQDGIFSRLKKKVIKKHTEGSICVGCNHVKKCHSFIPSGISYELFKDNIKKENKFKCEIFKIFSETNKK